MFRPDPELTEAVLAHVRHSLNTPDHPLGHPGKGSELTQKLTGLIGRTPQDPNRVLEVYRNTISPAVLSCNHPGFLSFIPGAPNPAARAFDTIVSADALHGVSWLEAAGAVAAENQVLSLIGSLAGFPPSAGGAFVSGGSAGNLAALAVARDERVRKTGRPPHHMRMLVSKEVHSSVVNAAHLLGVSLTVVPVKDGQLCAAGLAQVLAEDSDPQSFAAVIATGGTTNTGAIDDLPGIAEVAAQSSLWLHVDAAYGGGLLFSDLHRHLLTGIHLADSLVIDPHKWLFSSFDCGLVLYRDPKLARRTHAQDEGYLDVIHTGAQHEWNPSDYAYQLTRRPRGLPLWFSLAVHGTEAFGQAVNRGIALAQYAATRITESPVLSLTVPRSLSVIVFERIGWTTVDYQRWAEALLAQQIAFVSPSKHQGRTVARIAILHPHLQEATIDMILHLAEQDPMVDDLT